MTNSILERWDITPEELTEVIDRNPSLRGMILGYLAELKLEKLWLSGQRISGVIKHDDHDRKKKGDQVIRYKGHEFILLSYDSFIAERQVVHWKIRYPKRHAGLHPITGAAG